MLLSIYVWLQQMKVYTFTLKQVFTFQLCLDQHSGVFYFVVLLNYINIDILDIDARYNMIRITNIVF